MMRSLLADRFKLTVHHEARELPVYALVLAKPGTTGPQLRIHPDDSSCIPPAPTPNGLASGPPATVEGGFPAVCGGSMNVASVTGGLRRVGARAVNMQLIAGAIWGMADFDRPIIDQTGLNGIYDFLLEWLPAPIPPAPSTVDPLSQGVPTPRTAVLGPTGPTLEDALKTQLGLKLEALKGPVEVLVVDHLDHPSAN